jgi:hypothetical protein
MAKKLDPAVQKVLDKMLVKPTATFDNHMLEYAKGVADGSIKVKYFKASDIPEKKPVPEAFKKKAKAKQKSTRVRRRPPVYSHDEIAPAVHGRIMMGYSRQEVIQVLVENFRVSKHSAGYHYDKFVGKR